ncbi:MAG: class I SAM-dependent RNA methyltransferase [Holophagales bacterium]|nr:class I SAM-dependent RNA methyltransferase [Holophagales bacterium]MYD20842.1 class I SAM-dependent RNA methyltransferase [Holophagales bacterium]MYI33735.1 class I SAM-dependent RNA methyltransferase [Holophagales bacterium]
MSAIRNSAGPSSKCRANSMSSRAGTRPGNTDGAIPAAATTESTPRKRPLSAERLEALAALAGINRLELTIEKIVLGGDGLARWRGMPVFVPRAAPGDVVEARITERRPSYARAEIEEVKTAGPLRREAPCPFYERCGGCQLQHIEDAEQLGLKVAAAVETLRRLGGIDPAQLAACRFEEPVSERTWGYRLRAQVHVAPRSEGDERPDGSVGVGFRRRRSHDLVFVDRCPVLAPALENELRGLSSLLGDRAAASRTLPSRLSLATTGLERDDPVVAAPPVDGLPGGELEIDLQGKRLSYDARCFFQAHGGLLESLLLSAVGTFDGEAAVELYAGVGFFTVGLADRYQSVTAVEAESVAARYARNNLRRNGLRHCRVERSAVESWVDRRRGGPGLEPGLDRVLVDPPRAGLPRKVRSALLSAAPRRLTYVSCDPATLARDLGDLTRDFDLESISFFDVFPQTAHIETVAQLLRRP